MVSFVCNYCQQTLKKPKLDSHTYSCRNANFTCIDCNTDFHGTDYRTHTSCISEAQKYQKSLYKGNKNAAKSKQSKAENFEHESKIDRSQEMNKKRLSDFATASQNKKQNSHKEELNTEIFPQESKPNTEDLKTTIAKAIKEIFAEKSKMKFSKLRSKLEKKVKKCAGKIVKDELLVAIENHVVEALKNDEFILSVSK